MTTPFTGVLVTAKSKMRHLLVNMETRRSACDNTFKSGQRIEGTDTWNEPGPVQCRKCAAEWEKQNGQSNPNKGVFMPTGTSIDLQGIVHKTVIKPPVLDDEGYPKADQDVEIVLRVPLSDSVRLKLADLSRLQDGQTTHFTLENAQHRFDTTGARPEKKPPKSKKPAAKTTPPPDKGKSAGARAARE